MQNDNFEKRHTGLRKSLIKRIVTVALVLVLLSGLGLMLYPTISDLWNSYHQSRAVVTYAETVSGMTDEEKAEWRSRAGTYNESLAAKATDWELSEEEREDYESQMSITGAGIMGYVEVPKIGVSLSVYHGTNESVLQKGVGHLEGSSLPVGGESTHAVISGHRGLPSAKLFTDLDKLQEGDVFYLHVLEETMTYEVDQILTVEPDELDALKIQEGQDFCTLVTCTPYGINSHRLLVRGHRIPTPEPEDETILQPAEPEVDNTIFVVAIAAAPIVLTLAVILWLRNRRGRQGKHYAHKGRK